jgi:hypothetical protein
MLEEMIFVDVERHEGGHNGCMSESPRRELYYGVV